MGAAPLFQGPEHAYLQSQGLMKWLPKHSYHIAGHSPLAYMSTVDSGTIRGPIDGDRGCCGGCNCRIAVPQGTARQSTKHIRAATQRA